MRGRHKCGNVQEFIAPKERQAVSNAQIIVDRGLRGIGQVLLIDREERVLLNSTGGKNGNDGGFGDKSRVRLIRKIVVQINRPMRIPSQTRS